MRIARGLLLASALVMAAAVLGCAGPPFVDVRRTEPPLPAVRSSVTFQDEVFPGAGDVPLYARSYRPVSGDPRGVIVIHNGLKDHGDHYARFAQDLVERGYAAYAFDMRGHGRSAGRRVAVDRFDDFVDDLQRYVERVRAREPGRPIFVFGHSLGGAIVTLYAIERHPAVSGIIVSGPALAIDAPPIQAAVIRLLDTVAPQAPLFNQPHPDFSRDPAVVADMDRDPLIYQPGGPIHTANEVTDALHRIWSHPEQLTLPLLALHGTADHITAPSGSRDLVVRAGSSDKTLRLYDGYYHDLLHEPGRDRVVGDVLAWLDAHTGGPHAGAPPPSDAPLGASADTLPLRGDRASGSLEVEIDARAEKALALAGSPFGGTGDLRVRAGLGRIGWLGGADVRLGSQGGFLWEADAYPLGLGIRSGSAQLGVTGGIGGWGVDGTNVAHIPAEAVAEVPLGPTRLLARGSIAWRVSGGGPGTSVLGFADEANAFVAVRIGRDVRYWPDFRAGQGPLLGITYARRGVVDLWGLALGIALWGAN
jgi:alpha-beta hydrolase superfamily lysophospholipase